ncbi:hypothetical protein BGZ73_004534 [Actinomortierella ambigua]|nr:hypothetical protein BGZ73_004534 [Actinomortierella ambigua]
MTALTATAYTFRVFTLLMAGAVFGSCIWMQVTYNRHHTVIFRWKYAVEYALGGLTFFGYLFSFLFRRLSRVRTAFTSAVYLVLGTLLSAGWFYISLNIIISRQRQMVPVDYPTQMNRELIDGRDWSNYWVPNDDIFQCRKDPNSSLGASLSALLCDIDRSAATAGAACGLVVLLENIFSSLAEQTARRQNLNDQHPYQEQPEVELGLKENSA